MCVTLAPIRERLALAIARMAAQTLAGSGAQVNGVALDESAQPSVESLVLFYAAWEPHLFPRKLVQIAEEN
jgi:hypothetical protein